MSTKTKRLSEEDLMMLHALVAAGRSTCIRRKVGAVITDENNYILSTGRNGPAHDMPHCIEFPCGGENYKSGDGLSECNAIHAEINALLHCRDIFAAHKLYVLASPCKFCMDAILATPIREIHCAEVYSEAQIQRFRLAGGSITVRKIPEVKLNV